MVSGLYESQENKKITTAAQHAAVAADVLIGQNLTNGFPGTLTPSSRKNCSSVFLPTVGDDCYPELLGISHIPTFSNDAKAVEAEGSSQGFK
jgi:hypothetical protein